MSTLIQGDCVCYIHISKAVHVSKKIMFFVHMKVQFLLSWCAKRGVSELSPLPRNVHWNWNKIVTINYFTAFNCKMKWNQCKIRNNLCNHCIFHNCCVWYICVAKLILCFCCVIIEITLYVKWFFFCGWVGCYDYIVTYM